ncbi:methyl-accepting chemotaxis protein WspA [Labrys monachus]|uniref:Methyl-accepting chemotaxis protein WspA n=2 Tax=Labrys monachus TaxID=217067 RepID=A0ABU0FMA2_9HYPH|nr:methyl-accepting chemotaxis protein WspA [Labrys monachus]
MAAVVHLWLAEIEREAKTIGFSTGPALYFSAQMQNAAMNSYSLIEEFALQDNPSDRARVESEIKITLGDLDQRLAKYKTTIDTEEDQRNYDAVHDLVGQLSSAEEAVLQRGRASDASGAVADVRADVRNGPKPVFTRIQAALATMFEFNKGEADTSTRRIVTVVRSAETGLGIGFLAAVALSCLFGYLLFRAVMIPLGRLLGAVETMRQGDFSARLHLERQDEFSTLGAGFNAMADDLTGLIGQVQKSSIQVNTSITEVAATSKEQQATAHEIAATTTEIGATAKEIAATSNELARSMNDVSAVAEQTATLAGGGQAGLARMETTMRHVVDAAAAINAKLAILSEKAGTINQMVTTITKVADQTNLLSLNAAIEAEKAGQYGRGFAVVATEIRRLADQTAASTYDIEQMVRDIQSAVAAGVMGMDKFSEQVRRGMSEVQEVGGRLSEIIEQVQDVVPRFEAANEGMQAQAAGAVQISEALGQLSEAAQQTVESLQQSTLAIDELNQVSSGLRTSISRFKLRA